MIVLALDCPHSHLTLVTVTSKIMPIEIYHHTPHKVMLKVLSTHLLYISTAFSKFSLLMSSLPSTFIFSAS